MDKKKFYGKTEKILSVLKSGDNVLAALSGGADSVCLLLLLEEYCKKRNIALSAVHINHCLRADESDRDEAFCRTLCEKYRIPLKVHRIDVRTYCSENGLSCEEGARNLRYEIFRKEAGTGYIATAHNLNDNAETVLLNMTRGTGLKGLCGIPPIRNNIIRPLINIPRKDIEEFLLSKGESFVTDSTNLTDDFSRNKIRHRIIPVLGEINPASCENIGAMTDILRCEEDFINSEAKKLSFEINVLKSTHPALRRRFILSALKDAGLSPDSGMIMRTERVVLQGGREQLRENIFARCENGRLVIGELIQSLSYPDFSAPLVMGENPLPDGRILKAQKININKLRDINNSLTYYALDCDKIQGGIVLRTKRDGDVIHQAKENFSRKLKKIYNAKKIPLHLRSSAAVLEDERGIVFAEYCGVSAFAAPDEGSTEVYVIFPPEFS